MKKRSKRYKLIAENKTSVNFKEAVKIIKNQSSVKFDESIDLAIHLNLQKKHTIRDVITFRYPFVKSRTVLVFAKDKKAEEAKEAGADYVGGEEIIEKIKGGWLDFEVVIAAPDMMKSVTKIARILWSKGVMPNPKTKTVVEDVATAVREIKAGRKEFRANGDGVLNFSIGKKSMEEEKIIQNIKDFYELVLKKKPSDIKGEYINSIFLSSTMGNSLKIGKKNII
jgi:large subunit ribosomal protein L1